MFRSLPHLLLSLTGVLVLLCAPVASHADTCSVQAADASCSAEVTCAGPCVALSLEIGRCTARCLPTASPPATTPDTASTPPLDPAWRERKVTVHAQDLPVVKLAQLLSEQLGIPVHVAPDKRDETVSMNLVDAKAGDVVTALEHMQTGIYLEGTVPSSVSETTERTLDIELENATAQEFFEALVGVLGSRVMVKPDREIKNVTVQAKGVTARQVLAMVAQFGRAWVEGEEVLPAQ